jgi:O-methyltransferase
MLRKVINRFLNRAGFEIKRVHKDQNQEITIENKKREFELIPDQEMYIPLFCPSYNNGKGLFKEIMDKITPYTLVSADRCHILYTIAKQVMNIEGEFYECGVYKGGTAILISEVIKNNKGKYSPNFHLFDTFEGMPETNREKDWHKKGDFADTSIETVKQRLNDYKNLVFHKGFIPLTFSGNEDHEIAFAHIDVDIYKSIMDSCDFIYPRMKSGGMFVFDDYGFITCPGARMAVDDFFRNKKEHPLILPTGQAVVVKL